MKQLIDEGWGISLGIAAVLLGGMFWLGSVHAQAVQTQKAVERLESLMPEIRDRLTKMEAILQHAPFNRNRAPTEER